MTGMPPKKGYWEAIRNFPVCFPVSFFYVNVCLAVLSFLVFSPR